LTTLEERRELCGKLGIDYFLVMKFDRDLARQSFRDFYVKYLVEKIGVFMVVEGYNHHWGKDRLGNMELLKEIGKEFDFSVVSVGKIRYGDATVNSSLIREKLKDGKVEEAEELLGRPYRLSGTVVSGNKRGKSLGYPTANIKPDSPSKLLPKDGIYFVQAVIEERKYSGMASIGVRPTFESDGKRTVEVNIFDFDKDIYGRKLEVFFFRRLRDEFKYITKDELIRQMDRDKELSRKYESEIKNKI
jgi:riboflavin kinase/FMN adenylyltransferase